jgi:hypothetical protein
MSDFVLYLIIIGLECQKLQDNAKFPKDQKVTSLEKLALAQTNKTWVAVWFLLV